MTISKILQSLHENGMELMTTVECNCVQMRSAMVSTHSTVYKGVLSSPTFLTSEQFT